MLIGGGVTPLVLLLFGDFELDFDRIGDAPLFFGDFVVFFEFFLLFATPEEAFLPLEEDLKPLAPESTLAYAFVG